MSLRIKRRVKLDLRRQGYQQTIPFTKGDRVAHELVFTITDGAEPIKLPPGTLAAITVRNGADNGGDGVVDFCAVNHNDNTISYIPTEEALSVSGLIYSDIRVLDGDGALVGAPSFILQIIDNGAEEVGEAVKNGLRYSDNWGVIVETAKNAESARAAAAETQEIAKTIKTKEEERERNESRRIENDEKREKIVQDMSTLVGNIDSALDAILKIQEGLIGGTLEYEFGTSANGDLYYIVKGIGTYQSSHLVIPDTYEGVVVSEIAEDAFRGNTKLTSAVIGKNILTVGKCAFEGCANLTSIQLTKERRSFIDGGISYEECYSQIDTAFYSRFASDSDPAVVASLWTITQNEGEDWGDFDILSTDAWYWQAQWY